MEVSHLKVHASHALMQHARCTEAHMRHICTRAARMGRGNESENAYERFISPFDQFSVGKLNLVADLQGLL